MPTQHTKTFGLFKKGRGVYNVLRYFKIELYKFHAVIFGGIMFLGLISIWSNYCKVKAGTRTKENLRASKLLFLSGVIGFLLLVLPHLIK